MSVGGSGVFVGGTSVSVGGAGVLVGGSGVSVGGAGVAVGGVDEIGVSVGMVVGIDGMGVGTGVSDAAAVLVGVAPPEPNALPPHKVRARIVPNSPIVPIAATRTQGIRRRGDNAAPQ